jgi:hypothetical protein
MRRFVQEIDFTPSPYVDREASRDRAISETRTGEWIERRRKVQQLIEESRDLGLTYKALAHLTGLHHGQISSCLSKMHEEGLIFALRLTRDRCHPYVAQKYRASFKADEIYETPVKTRAKKDHEIALAARMLIEVYQNSDVTSTRLNAFRELCEVIDANE